MIPKDIFASYSQYNEDIILDTLLSNVSNGFYVDVGANHEEYHSVTKLFYKKGWTGINIEPIPRLLQEFISKRKNDTNLQLAVSNKRSVLTLREYPEHDGLSTLDERSMKDSDHTNLPYKDYDVKVDTLAHIFSRHQVTRIDFLKVDVEGYEQEVLEGNDWESYRPTIICIEANHRASNWAKLLAEKQYKRFIFDGLNEYYVAKESWGVTEKFAEGATLRSHSAIRNHNLKLWQDDIKYIKKLENMTRRQDELIKSTQNALTELQKRYKDARKLTSIVRYYGHKVIQRTKQLSRKSL
jgi:FkbM family methyltransferase